MDRGVRSSSVGGLSPASAAVTSDAALAGAHVVQQLPRGGAEATAAPGGREAGTFEWPAVSFARMRAGLRSALKTECSGFKFQNGGRSLRWFREHPEDAKERARLFWQGHVSLFEQHWDIVKIRNEGSLAMALERLDRVFRERYSVHTPASRTAFGRHVRAMSADGNVERALRWALERHRETENALLSLNGSEAPFIMLALGLQGSWTWLLERWQTVVGSRLGVSVWRGLIAAAAVDTGSLTLVQEHWAGVQVEDERMRKAVAQAIGRSGSLEAYVWLREHGLFADDDIVGRMRATWHMMLFTAVEYGHVHLACEIMSGLPAPRQRLDELFPDLLFQWSCTRGHAHAVEWLVSRGMMPTVRDFNCAVAGARVSIVRYLREQVGLTNIPLRPDDVETLLSQSNPGCLLVLEYLVQHWQYKPTSKHIARAATASNVRPDVLRLLARHATQEVWDGALLDRSVCNDMNVQDLLHAAAVDV